MKVNESKKFTVEIDFTFYVVKTHSHKINENSDWVLLTSNSIFLNDQHFPTQGTLFCTLCEQQNRVNGLKLKKHVLSLKPSTEKVTIKEFD